jgi:hypothetical protein
MIVYLLFETKRNRQNIFYMFKEYSNRFINCLEMPFIKFQHNAERGETYFFGVAVNLESINESNDAVNWILNDIENIPFRKRPKLMKFREDVFWPEEEMGFLRDKSDWQSFMRQVIFEEYGRNRDGNIIGGLPVAFETNDTCSDDEYRDESYDDILITKNALIQDDECLNHLLWWCSAKGEGSFQGFKEACELLELSIPGDGKAWNFMRRFILLGHIEAVEEGHKFNWGVTPTAIVKPTIGDAYIAGMMTPFLEKSLSEKVNLQKTTSNGGPLRITIPNIEVPCSYGVPIIQDAAGRLAEALPYLKEWQNSLDEDPDILPHRYSFKIFNGKSFVELNDAPPTTGLYLATRREGDYQKPTLTFYDGDRWMRGGYYDLRWLGIKNISISLTVWIDKKGSLTIPEIGHWPLLYERPLVLASGTLPKKGKVNMIDALIYDSVGLGLARILCEKLKVKMEVI